MKSRIRSVDPLPNPRHEAFAREIASGQSATQAYINIYGTENRRVASTGGSRLLLRQPIAARIRALQQAGAACVALDLAETLDFLARVVRTPAGEVLPSSDLCARVKRTRDGSLDVWMPNKLACLRLSARLQGFLYASPARTSSARTTNPVQTPAQSGIPAPSQPGAPIILTEELREILLARRSAVIPEHEDQPLAQNLCPEKQRHAEEQSRPEQLSHPEPNHHADSTPTPQPTDAPTAPPARPNDCPTETVDNIPGIRAPSTPGTNNLPKAPRKDCTGEPGNGRRNHFPSTFVQPEARLAPSTNPPPNPTPSVANPPRLSVLNYPLSTQPPLSRVTPDDSSVLIII